MNGNLELIKQFAKEEAIASSSTVQVLVTPPAIYLIPAWESLSTRCIIASQTISEHVRGAYTGEVSAAMLADVGIEWTLIGHSERRTLYKEDDACVKAKLSTAWAAGLSVILCVGEPLDVRSQGDEAAERFVYSQLEAVLGTEAITFSVGSVAEEEKGEGGNSSGNNSSSTSLTSSTERLVVAYEPIWAIGTGQVASAAAAQKMHVAIRRWLAGQFGPQVASHVRIIYGGSVTAGGAEELAQQGDIDGFLVGGASLKPAEFGSIIQTVKKLRQ